MRSPAASRLVFWVLILIGAAALLPILVLSFDNQPWNDDFCFTWWVDNHGFFGAQLRYYLDWSGRYFSTLMMVASPVTFRWLPGYKLLGFAIASLLTLSFACWIRGLLRTGMLATAGLTAATVTLALLGMPSMGEGIFWFPAAATYTGGVILACFLTGLLLAQDSGQGSPGPLATGAAVLLILAMVGTTETITLIWCGAAFSCSAASWWRHRRLQRHWKILLGVTLTAALLVALAPGNQLRAQRIAELQVYGQHQEIAGNVAAVLQATVSRVAHDLIGWLTGSPLWALFFLLLPFSRQHPLPDSLRARFAIHPLKAAALGTLLLMAGYFPSFWVTGLVEGRTENLLFLLFLPGWFYFVLLCCYRFQHRLPNPRFGLALCLLIAAGGLGLDLLRPNPVQAAYQDWLSGVAGRYDEEVSAIHARLEECDTPVCEAPSPRNRPRSFAVGGIAADPDDWRNTCLSSAFFHLQRKIRFGK